MEIVSVDSSIIGIKKGSLEYSGLPFFIIKLMGLIMCNGIWI